MTDLEHATDETIHRADNSKLHVLPRDPIMTIDQRVKRPRMRCHHRRQIHDNPARRLPHRLNRSLKHRCRHDVNRTNYSQDHSMANPGDATLEHLGHTCLQRHPKTPTSFLHTCLAKTVPGRRSQPGLNGRLEMAVVLALLWSRANADQIFRSTSCSVQGHEGGSFRRGHNLSSPRAQSRHQPFRGHRPRPRYRPAHPTPSPKRVIERELDIDRQRLRQSGSARSLQLKRSGTRDGTSLTARRSHRGRLERSTRSCLAPMFGR